MAQGAENDLNDLTLILEVTPVHFIRDNVPLENLNANTLIIDGKAIFSRDKALQVTSDLATHISAIGATAHAGATTSTAGFISADGKRKLDGIEHGAQIDTMSVVDAIELISRKETTIHRHPDATTGTSGFMSFTDKIKLNGIETGAQANRISNANATTLTDTSNADALHLHPFSSTVETFTELVHDGTSHAGIPGTSGQPAFDTSNSYLEGSLSAGSSVIFTHTYPFTVQSFTVGVSYLTGNGAYTTGTWEITDISVSGNQVTVEYIATGGWEMKCFQGAYG